MLTHITLQRTEAHSNARNSSKRGATRPRVGIGKLGLEAPTCQYNTTRVVYLLVKALSLAKQMPTRGRVAPVSWSIELALHNLLKISAIFAEDRLHLGIIFEQARYSALGLHYLCTPKEKDKNTNYVISKI